MVTVWALDASTRLGLQGARVTWIATEEIYETGLPGPVPGPAYRVNICH